MKRLVNTDDAKRTKKKTQANPHMNYMFVNINSSANTTLAI